MLEQLPEDVQKLIYIEFLFRDFLKDYAKTFSFENVLNPNQPSFFTWEDHCYRVFMQAFLSKLEPRKERPGTMILNELDEVDEVIFFN